MEFDDFQWHDAVIKDIQIDRSCPGKKDEILFTIKWSDDLLNQIVFEDVYWATLSLGFGVVAEEAIYEAFIAPRDDSDFTELLKKWNGILKEDELFCYVIKTASTGSEIKIIAKRMAVMQ